MASRLGRDAPTEPVGHRATPAFWPSSRLGWWSVGLTLAALAYWGSWRRLGILSDAFGKWAGMAGAGVLAGLAVVALVFAVWHSKERSLLPFICTALIVANALFWLLFLGGERLLPH